MGFTIQSACLHADWQVPLIKLLVGGKMNQTTISKIRSKLIERNYHVNHWYFTLQGEALTEFLCVKRVHENIFLSCKMGDDDGKSRPKGNAEGKSRIGAHFIRLR